MSEWWYVDIIDNVDVDDNFVDDDNVDVDNNVEVDDNLDVDDNADVDDNVTKKWRMPFSYVGNRLITQLTTQCELSEARIIRL